MKTEIISFTNPTVISRALSVLQDGGLIAYPTDTVYGLAAATFSPSAIEKLFDAKTREATKAIAVLIGDMSQLDFLTPNFPESARRLAQLYWPGALTMIVPKLSTLPENLSQYPTVGVRMPNHAFALTLLRHTGPLATTSANLSGGANPSSPEEVLEQLNGRIELLIDGGVCPGGTPSTVLDCTQETPVVLRQGSISAEMIQNALKGI
jgi:L-threonylcarbamoyladenylate synthase